ncbi:MAG TPA: ABC transporter permease, partial [Burkholderiaceae bacterium]|nr:ABC transporter permease [Burkholderiaceae bacterium]
MNATWLLRRLALEPARAHPVRALVQFVAVALGVALGFAVHLINSSALAEFAAAARELSGTADAIIRGERDGFDESLLAEVARDDDVVDFNPVVETDVVVADPAPGRGRMLTILGIDALRAARMAPSEVGQPLSPSPSRPVAPDRDTTITGEAPAPMMALLQDGIFLSPAASVALRARAGDDIVVDAGGTRARLRVAGLLPAIRPGRLVAAMDIAYAQWRLGRLGRLTRIDLKLASGASKERLARDLRLPPGVRIEAPDDDVARIASLSHAYRVNLNALALVALFTGAFLVFSLQSQSAAARQREIALLRVLGMTRRQVERLVVAEALAIGLAGAIGGLAIGAGGAAAALRWLGGDLGGGYFRGVQPALALDLRSAALFLLLGVAGG